MSEDPSIFAAENEYVTNAIKAIESEGPTGFVSLALTTIEKSDELRGLIHNSSKSKGSMADAIDSWLIYMSPIGERPSSTETAAGQKWYEEWTKWIEEGGEYRTGYRFGGSKTEGAASQVWSAGAGGEFENTYGTYRDVSAAWLDSAALLANAIATDIGAGYQHGGTGWPSKTEIKKAAKSAQGASAPAYAQALKAIMGTAPQNFGDFTTSPTSPGNLVKRLVLPHFDSSKGLKDDTTPPQFKGWWHTGYNILDTTFGWSNAADGKNLVYSWKSDRSAWIDNAGVIIKMPMINWWFDSTAKDSIPTLYGKYGIVYGHAGENVADKGATWENVSWAAGSTTSSNIFDRFELWRIGFYHLTYDDAGKSISAWRDDRNLFTPQEAALFKACYKAFDLKELTETIDWGHGIADECHVTRGGHYGKGGAAKAFQIIGCTSSGKLFESGTPLTLGASGGAQGKDVNTTMGPLDVKEWLFDRAEAKNFAYAATKSNPLVYSYLSQQWTRGDAGTDHYRYADTLDSSGTSQGAFFSVCASSPLSLLFFGTSVENPCWLSKFVMDPEYLKRDWYKNTFAEALKETLEVIMEIRKLVRAIYQLNANLQAAGQHLQETIADYASDPDSLSESDREDLAESQSIIDKIKSGDITVASTGFNKRMKFKEQCYLLANVFNLAQENKYPPAIKCLPTEHPQRVLLVNSDQTYGFLNKLVMDGSQAAYYKMTPADLSSLQPMIRLYKVEYEKGGKAEREVLMQFETTTTLPSDALKARKTRGVGSGIKSFNFTYDGSNPFAAKKSIKATLKIYANNFDELMKMRESKMLVQGDYRKVLSRAERANAEIFGTGPKKPTYYTSKYRYIDLALKTGGTTKNNTKCNTKYEANINHAKLNFRLKAVVGWAAPKAWRMHGGLPGLEHGSFLATKEMRRAIYNSYVTLNLTPTVHNFEFGQDGTVVLTINYLAYIDDYFEQNSFNIFSDRQSMSFFTVREMALKTAKNSCDKTTENFKKRWGEMIMKEKQTAIQSIIRALLDTDKIKYVEYGYDSIRTFMSKGPFAEEKTSTPKVLSQVGAESAMLGNTAVLLNKYTKPATRAGAVGVLDKAQLTAALTAVDPNTVYIPFFYISDLLGAVTQLIDLNLQYVNTNLRKMVADAQKPNWNLGFASAEKQAALKLDACYVDLKEQELRRQLENFRKMRIVLGPCEIVNHAAKGAQVAVQSKTVSFGDMPISVKYFVEFLTERMASKDRVIYPLGKFMNDLFNNLVRNFLNDDTCFIYPVKQKTIVNQSVITSYGQNNQDEITYTACMNAKASAKGLIGNDTDVSLLEGKLNISGPSDMRSSGGFHNEINYMVYSAGRSQPKELMNGDREEDLARGVHHYQVGRRKGMIKEIKLSKTQTSGLAELRFEQDGYEGLKQLRVIYDVEIDAYAMPKAFPGVYLYVDPKGFAPNANTTPNDPMNLSEYGIGGYYMVYKSEHRFAAGQATSKLYAKWVAQLANSAKEQTQDTTMGDGDDRKKCT